MSSNVYSSELAFVWLVTQFPQSLKNLAPRYLTGYGSLAIFKRLPPEILEEVFVHTCGNEYITFFDHFSLPLENDGGTGGIQRTNTVYVLKAVCKEWRDLAERIPRLWQRIHFDFDDFWIEYGLFRSAQHFADMMKHVLLPRSAGLGLHIQIRGQRFPRDQLDVRSRMQYFVPCMHALAGESHRWTNLDLYHVESSNSDANSAIHSTLAHIMATTSFPNLHLLIYQSATVSQSRSLSLDLASSAPCLTSLILRGGNFQRLNGALPSLRCRWHNLTSLVVDPDGYLNSWRSAVEQLVPVLQAVRQSLVRLQWMGSRVFYIGAPSEYLPTSRTPIEFERLRELTLEDSTCIRLCQALLPWMSCPVLQTFELLLCHPWAAPGTCLVEQLPQRLSATERFLFSAPLLHTITILQVPDLRYHELGGEKPRRDNKHIHHGYLFVGGSPLELRVALQDCLVAHHGLSLLDLFAQDPDTLKRHILVKAMRFTPYATYSPIPIQRRMTERPRLLPPRITTAWEEGQWRNQHRNEIEHTERLLAFAHFLSLKYRRQNVSDFNAMMGALDAMNDASMVVLVYLLEMMRHSGDTIPSTCVFTLSVAV